MPELPWRGHCGHRPTRATERGAAAEGRSSGSSISSSNSNGIVLILLIIIITIIIIILLLLLIIIDHFSHPTRTATKGAPPAHVGYPHQ